MAEKEKSKTIREFGISSFSVDNATSIVIVTLIITVMGLGAYRSMPKESFPEIVIPTVYIGTPYPGNSPVDMENLISRPIEKELKSLNDVKDIKSTSVQDFSSIVVEFNPGIEISKAIQELEILEIEINDLKADNKDFLDTIIASNETILKVINK